MNLYPLRGEDAIVLLHFFRKIKLILKTTTSSRFETKAINFNEEGFTYRPGDDPDEL